jgi:hypothetical protein
MTTYRIKAVAFDDSGFVPGPGFVIVDQHGDRIDWPMLTTLEEARKDQLEFICTERQLASDEASELAGLEMMTWGNR